jgi:hypothetical protein
MARALRNAPESQSAVPIPTKREIELFLLAPHRECPEIIEELIASAAMA